MANLKALLKQAVAKNIVLFFNENPNSIDTAKGISVWIGFPVEDVQKSLNILKDAGVLINHRSSSTDAYSYTNNKALIKKVERYIKKI